MNTMDKIETLTRQLGQAISESEAFLRLQHAREENDQNLQLQEKISNFNLKKIALNHETNRPEKDEEKISRFDREMREIYAQIMAEPTMTAYAEAKDGMDKIMQDIQTLLRLTLEGEDPMTVELPKAGGCSGNCSSCGGCH